MSARIGRLLLCMALPCMLSALAFGFAPPDAAVFINEIHYDNTGTDAGEAVEIAGPAGTDLGGWSLILYNGSGGAVYGTFPLSGIIPDQQGGFGVIALSFPANGLQNGGPDGIALAAPDGTLAQFLSYEGAFTAVGGPADALGGTDIGVVEGSDTPAGYSLQLTGGGTAYGAFSWAGPSASNFGQPNAGQTFAVIVNAPVVVTCGDALTAYEGSGAERVVTASDADGTVTGIAIAVVDPVPAAGGISLSGLTPAGGPGGTAGAVVSVDPATPPGQYAVTIVALNSDSPAQAGTAVLGVNIMEVLAIGEVQGSVGDAADGLAFASPYAGSYVVVRGVIYQNILSRTSSGGSNYGFFLQNTAGAADADPNSSDGIYVYMGRYTSLIGGYVPTAGDEVILRGRVSEYYGLTELSSAAALAVARSGVDLDSELPAFDADPPADLADAYRYWERREGMRARVPGGSVVLSGRNVFASTLDGEVWVALHSSPIALRADPYERRAFRDPHPLDDLPGLFDNGNGWRIVMGSLGLKAAAGDNAALIAPARTFDTMVNAPVGGVYYSYEKYQIQVEEQPELVSGADPSLDSPPEPFDRGLGYGVVTYNMENLYDYRDDPFDPCDFPGNPGTPEVSPPFDYVPSSDDAYQARLAEIAEQVVSDLHSPDILLVQEVEDQDIAFVEDGLLVFGDADNADGRPDALQELALGIKAAGGPAYQAAFDRDGADDRGIVSAFLYRTDRVELLPAASDNPVLGAVPWIVYRAAGLPQNADVQNPKALNAALPSDVDVSTGVDGANVFTRAPVVGLFRVWRGGIGSSVFTDLYCVSSHFSSGPDSRVGQRSEQAAYSAAIVAALKQADQMARVVIAGDFNVYPRPDDPFSPGQPLYPSDQLAALYGAGMTNLFDRLVSEAPAAAYGYVYEGQAQTLDQMFVTSPLLEDLRRFRPAHINSDWPSDYPGDGPRGTSDHDPQAATIALAPTLEGVEALVRWHSEGGAISGARTERILVACLERARRFRDRGMDMAAYVQLRVFILLTRGLSPRFLTEGAAEALEGEAELLLTLQCRLEDLPSPKLRDLKEAAAGLLETDDLGSRIRDWERQRH